MNPELKALLDKYAAKGANDAELRAVAAEWTRQNAAASQAPQPAAAAGAQEPESTMKGFGRAFVQHGLFNFGDELGVVDQSKQTAFAKNHPVLDFLATLGGTAAAPIVATAAAPELATVGGVAALGGVAGLLSGAGDQDPNDQSPGQMDSRGGNAAVGGAAGLAGGYAGAKYVAPAVGKLVKPIAKSASAMMDHFNPARPLAREAAQLMDSGVQSRMNNINELAPGGASIASASTPETGLSKMSRFTGITRDLSASAPAAAQAENDIVGQQAALKNGMQRFGQMIQANNKDVEMTPQVRAALRSARDLIGRYAPEVPPESAVNGNPLGLEQSTPFTFDEEAKTISTNQLHEILSRMRSTMQNMAKRGIDAPGQQMHDYSQASNAVKRVLYNASPKIAQIDRAYGQLADQVRVTDKLLTAVQRGRSTGAGNRVANVEPVTPGGSVTKTTDTILGLVKRLFVNHDARPNEIAKYITKPGGADAVAQLLQHLPATHPATTAIRSGIKATLPTAMKSMFDQQEEQ